MFEPEVFRKQSYYFDESNCDIFGNFRSPLQSFGARGILPSLPLVTLLKTTYSKPRLIRIFAKTG